jgi:glutamate/tyrosine decarboxylase-like PLP-dependent enzyme
VFPDSNALADLASFDEPLPEQGYVASDVLRLLDEKGSPATVASNDPRYFGFVIGASLPAAAATERLMLAWDQCASSFDNSPIAAKIEQIASGWVLEALDLLVRAPSVLAPAPRPARLFALRQRGAHSWRGKVGTSTATA